MIDFKERIGKLCRLHTGLSEADIAWICEIAESFENTDVKDDVFIDVLSSVANEAIVVYHRRPNEGKSLYKRPVTGEKALRENEPGVLRTLETGMMSQGLVANTQENHLVRQTVYPMKNQDGVIAVVIYEKDVSDNIQAHFNMGSGVPYEDGEMSSMLTAMLRFKDSLINQLEDAVLVFDKYGFLKLKNKQADAYYRQLGYLEDIQGLHYDNLSLDRTMFSEVMKQHSSSPCCPLTTDVKAAGRYFQVKRLFIEEKDLCVGVILHDVTEIKDKEAEIISKSVAIREIHHRVKNNLQTVASLLRIQGRQCKSPEAKKCLDDSVSRVLAIAATHELLSTEIDAQVDLLDVIRLIATNIERCFLHCHAIEMDITSTQSICLDSDRTVDIALIVSELLHNSYEHAFGDCTQGKITVHAQAEGDLVTVIVADNGTGFAVEDAPRKSLGLSIVRSYVKDKLKGKLTIASGDDGTAVTFTFKK
ncbi:sensor histidine kinase [Paenibacillus alvei]|uniref:sensor histidine kinase n=1 Tax=Paenibacillus TaxID=44249 RepID=UPI0002896A78|nr:sensor histidine kinase [Paenibacillus alvei]EJW16415.1 putative sensor histidine kinase PdtaS [Paenibacillus alvei DSM 29]MCY9543111.1 sensor histidine kinase [Paenibacillus alvei]MCY9707886.1 sensor histidine kinase [Paenibacillus alvei]MCY9736261.1 sensor histidine kinase [Paenibacillus alvei]MCY9756958.1 sensor histidine kinase [Paenibacillus alvei]